MANDVQITSNITESTGPGIDWLGLGLGVLTGGVGGILGAIGPSIFGTLSNALTSQGAITQSLLQKIPEFVKESMYSAAGRTGEATRAGFEQQFRALQQSADARTAAQALQSLSSNLLSQAARQGAQTTQTFATQLGSQSRQALDAVKQAGGGVSAMARTASQLGQSYGQGLSQALNTIGNQTSQLFGQAAAMRQAAPEILNRDLATRYQTFVRPFEAQMSNIGTSAMSSLPSYTQQLSRDAAVVNPLAGFSAALGGVGGEFISSSITPGSPYYWLKRNYRPYNQPGQ